MISPEILRRYPFFAGLNVDQITTLAQIAQEISVETGYYFFREGDDLKNFYLVLEGAVAIVVAVTDRDVEQKIAEQLTGELETKDVTASTAGTGDIFGFSGLAPPHRATAGAKAIVPCRVLVFECEELRQVFEDDCPFGLVMMQKAAQVIRERLRDMRIQSLADLIERGPIVGDTEA
jgi:CRP-like cAMP-binding protein